MKWVNNMNKPFKLLKSYTLRENFNWASMCTVLQSSMTQEQEKVPGFQFKRTLKRGRLKAKSDAWPQRTRSLISTHAESESCVSLQDTYDALGCHLPHGPITANQPHIPQW